MRDFLTFAGSLVIVLAMIGLVASFRDHVLDKERPFSQSIPQHVGDIGYDEIVVDPEYAANERAMIEAADHQRDGIPARLLRSRKAPPGPLIIQDPSLLDRHRLGSGLPRVIE